LPSSHQVISFVFAKEEFIATHKLLYNMDKTDIKDDSENITLRVRDQTGEEMFFKVCNLYDNNDCFISSIR
jgi:hypothetical protein